MCPPLLLMARFGRRGRVPIPLPLVILWPVAIVVGLIRWVAAGAARL
jgi:hypothetical protein